MTFTLRTALLRGLDIISIEVEFVANRDEFSIDCVTPISITGEDEIERPCASRAELIITGDEARQLLDEGEAELHRRRVYP